VRCGSAGDTKDEKLVACVQCGEAYHIFCIEGSLELTRQVLDKGWRCIKCKVHNRHTCIVLLGLVVVDVIFADFIFFRVFFATAFLASCFGVVGMGGGGGGGGGGGIPIQRRARFVGSNVLAAVRFARRATRTRGTTSSWSATRANACTTHTAWSPSSAPSPTAAGAATTASNVSSACARRRTTRRSV
jgi:hypothetical protein